MKKSLLRDVEGLDNIIKNTSDTRIKEMWKSKKDLKKKIEQREDGSGRTTS
jgi:hypothetical protein|tara:strand:+ start:202 stop:354 length:153 start_codon:yes stop_codon:yes gene_type:complete